MEIGVPAETKPQELRVGMTPAGVRELVRSGHRVTLESGAGLGAGHEDDAYVAAGATIGTVEDAWAAELIVKVKEPQAPEVERISSGQIVFTYLHLAAEPELAAGLQRSGATCIAYETVVDRSGRLPLLAPMSEIAGRLSAQVGAHVLTAPGGGAGILIGGLPGTKPAEVLVLGGGVAGSGAARIAAGLGARVTVLDRSLPRLRELETELGRHVRTLHANDATIAELLPTADLVIGAVLLAGARAPRLVRREQLATMRPGSVLMDISIDQGGCFETSRGTSHADPTYVVDGIVHYAVTNMPGAVPVSSTHALTAATIGYVVSLANHGVDGAFAADPGLAAGLNVRDGEITHRSVAEALSALPA